MVTRVPSTLAPQDAERLLAGPAASIPSLVLAAGPEEFLRDRVVHAFRAGAAAESSEFQRLEGDDLDAATLLEALTSVSLFADTRRVWIREAAKLEKGAEEALLQWAAGRGEGVRVLVTTAREVTDLKVLQSLATRATVVTLAASPAELKRWADRLVTTAGLKLPSGALDAIASRSNGLLALSQELEKLRLHASADGRLPAAALDSLAGSRGGASVERWAAAVIAGDVARARVEAAALEAEGEGGTAALWAVAERALYALDPSPYGYRRSSGPPMRPADARRALEVVYRADRALKRGELRDAELRDFVEREIAASRG
jgi:DNA polymerase III delta subunit